MNEAAELVSDSILGEGYSIDLSGKIYTIYPPCIKVVLRTIREFSKISMDGEYTPLNVLSEAEGNAPHIIKGLSLAIAGDCLLYKIKAFFIKRRLLKMRFSDLKELNAQCISMMGGEDFFQSAILAKNAAKMVAKQK